LNDEHPKEFTRGQIVEIFRTDPGEDPRWVGLRCEVADTYLFEYAHLFSFENTKLIPLSDRPDADGSMDPRGWFFWPTADIRLVDDSKDEREEA
jgi:hypothetical protein